MNKGYAIILTGYISWGLFPLYWALLSRVDPTEVLAHRILWSVPVLTILVLFSQRRKRQFSAALHSRRELGWLCCSGLLITLNWGIYIWAVTHHRVVEASMGYFLTPLLNVLSGMVFFRERPDPLSKIAIAIAAGGVAYYIFSTQFIPWVSFVVGISFAGYGLMRKQMDTNAVPGLLMEVLILLPFTLGYVIWLQAEGEAAFLHLDPSIDLWLILAGPVTVLPLAFFTAGTRLLPMASVGILFYVTPSLQFLIGTVVMNEAFDTNKLLGFIGIWTGLAIFSFGLLTNNRSRKPVEAELP